MAHMNFALVLLLLTLFVPQYSLSIARTIKLPLIRGTSQNAGQYNQPVISYYTPVKIGTPPIEMSVQFDVGLSDLFVPHYEWSPFKINLHYGKGYQCKSSSTCSRDKRDVTISYQNCKLTGKPYEDLIMFTNALSGTSINETLEAPVALRQKFLAANDASDARFKDLPVDGFFGLGTQSQSTSALTNILINLQQANLIDNLQFSFWFNPILDSNQGGELTLGGIDEARYQGQIYWHHLTNMNNEWSLPLQMVNVANQTVSCFGEQCQVSFSSAINEIVGPKVDVEKIYQLLGTTRSGYLQYVDCNKVSSLPYISFSIDGIPYALLPTNYIRKTSNGKCYVSILPSLDGQKRWVLGTNFLGAYYSTFDMTYRQIGFASMR